MAGDTTITIIGSLGQDPDLKFLSSGAAVASFSVASTPRAFDKNSNEWKDQETLWMRCSAWRELGENVAESLHKGDRVIVTGRLKSRSFEQEGAKRTVIELEVDEVGPSLRFATAQVARAPRGDGGQRPPNVGGGNAWSGKPDGPQSGPAAHGGYAQKRPAGATQGENPWAEPAQPRQAAQPTMGTGWGREADSAPF